MSGHYTITELQLFKCLDVPLLSCVLNQSGNSIQLEVWAYATINSLLVGPPSTNFRGLYKVACLKHPDSCSIAGTTLKIPFLLWPAHAYTDMRGACKVRGLACLRACQGCQIQLNVLKIEVLQGKHVQRMHSSSPQTFTTLIDLNLENRNKRSRIPTLYPCDFS